MTNLLAPVPKQKFFTNNGVPASGYQLFTYEAGTSTKLDTYPDESTGTPNSNPIELDFRGECDLWIPPNIAYKFVLAPPNDTDPPTAPIWTVDDIVDSQLLTLYGGVDTGAANAYILNFTANFTAYADGIIIYWIPSNTNTSSASTVNVNGLGPVAILNQNGGTLAPGQIRANQVVQMMYQGTGFRLLSSTLLPIIFGACRTTNQSLVASTVNTVIFDVNVDNPQTAYSLTTGIFTCPDTGTYFFSVSMLVQNDAANSGVLNGIYLSKNDSTGTPGQVFYLSGFAALGATINGATNAIPTVGTVSIPLVAGDTVRVKVDLGAGFGGGGAFNVKALSYFSGARVA